MDQRHHLIMTVRIGAVLESVTAHPLLILLLALILTSLISVRTSLLTPNDKTAWAKPSDHHKYVYMSQHPIGSFHIDPTARRIGVPFLVRLTRLDPVRGFFLVAFL